MIATERTSRRKPSPVAPIQKLTKAAQDVFTVAQLKAYGQGILDFESGTRDHPPYGFSDLQQAWKAGWLAGKQKKEGLNGGSRACLDGKSA